MAGTVDLDAVSKRFRLYHGKPTSLKERVINFGRIPHEDFWALRDVTFHVDEGETVGLLGHNGSGKSTLLKCVAGIIRPTSGRILTTGRVAALLELGAGFHPDLTGRENVFLNGSILGLTRGEVERRFDDIVAFAELEAFIDTQVKHYSSGMYARLGFAVAVNVEPDVLLVDEVLAVGDESFQHKCLDRVKSFQREGRTVFFVTHAADLVRRICDRAVVLDHGDVLCVDDPPEAIRVFREALLQRGIEVPLEARGPVALAGDVKIADVDVRYADPNRGYAFSGEPVTIRLRLESEQPVDDVVASIAVFDQAGNKLLGVNTQLLGIELGGVDGAKEVEFRLERVALLDGVYFVSTGVHTVDGGVDYDHRSQHDTITVVNRTAAQGLVDFSPVARVVDGRPSGQEAGAGSGEAPPAQPPRAASADR